MTPTDSRTPTPAPATQTAAPNDPAAVLAAALKDNDAYDEAPPFADAQ
jgi:hypothetical protein